MSDPHENSPAPEGDEVTAADELDELDEGTVMVDRSSEQNSEPEDGTIVVDRTPEPDDGTVVVDRTAEPDDGTVVVDRTAEPDDGTVVVDRTAEPDDGTVVVDRTAEPDDGTVVVDRTQEPDDGTIVVDRSADADDGTVVVDRSAEPDDGTVVVERAPAASATPAKSQKRAAAMRTLPRRGANRQITRAPGADANKTGTLAPGAGAVAAYEARVIPPAPAAAPAIQLGPDATRANAPSMPSVSKQSRRRGLIALSAAAGAVVVSVVGLVLVLGALIRG